MNWNRSQANPRRVTTEPQEVEAPGELVTPGSLWGGEKGPRVVVELSEEKGVGWRRPDSERVNWMRLESWKAMQLSGELVYDGPAEA